MAIDANPPPGGAGDLQAAIAALWRDARPRTISRIETLEDAIAALLEDALDDGLVERARREAHKLAGSLGTFGMPDATQHARAVEHRFEAGAQRDAAPLLAQHVTALRRIVEDGPPPPTDGAAPESGSHDVVLAGLDAARAAQLERALHARGIAARAAEHAPGARVALVGGSPERLLERVSRLADEETRVAALVPFGGRTDRVALVRAGAARILPEDLGLDALADELATLVAGRREASDRVLVVDDDPEVLAVVGDVLAAAGHEVTVLSDPKELWTALERSRPALIILDVDMPGVDGIALCRSLRADANWASTPVLFLTVAYGPSIVAELFAAGADDYVLKPFAGPELVARVGNRLERVRLLRASAGTDPVSGLELRGLAQARLKRLCRHADRLGLPLAVGIVRLVAAAETGIEAADAALTETGRTMRTSLGPEDVGARWSDDELLVGQLGLGEHDIRELLGSMLADLGRRGVALAAGIAVYPRDGEDLSAIMRDARAAAVAAAEPGAGPVVVHGWDRERPERVDIALVEDDDALAGVLEHALATRGYRTRVLPDGDEAARLLGGPRPSLEALLVLLDWDLPGRDGLTVLRGLAADGRLADTTVVMLTARASEREVLAALELGASDHVAKPISIPVLMQKVRSALERPERRE
jgi:DNA-binding response OmpR family regulator/HPt (histidine-containing phosphotransfer) domain-containing protein